MRELMVNIERDGLMRLVGRIRGETEADACFTYAEAYRSSPDAAPISLSLPLQEEAFSPAQTKRFFEGLLPEGFTRRTVAQWMHVAEDEGQAFEELPSDWKCPRCKQPKEKFNRA